MKKLVLAFATLAFCAFSIAETPRAINITLQQEATARLEKQRAMEAVVRSPLATTDCSLTFHSGVGIASLKYCVTANGNLVQVEAPEGHSMVSETSHGEGYGICDVNTQVAYFDYAGQGDSGNWNPATVVSHTAKAVQITRTTHDGLWTLTQTISLVVGTPPLAKITMALKNNSSGDKRASLVRYADVDADGQALNNLDATRNRAFAWNSFSSQSDGLPIGLALENIDAVPIVYTAFAEKFARPTNPCDPFADFVAGLVKDGDGSLVAIDDLDIPKSSAATMTVGYRGW